VKKFAPLQIGICPFVYSKENDCYTAHPYNFYILPLGDEDFNIHFLSQVSSLDFLTRNNFDFNKLFYEGLHYISREQRMLMQDAGDVRKIKREIYSDEILNDIEYQAFQQLYWDRCKDGVTNSEVNISLPIKYVKVRVYKFFEKEIQDAFPRHNFAFSYDTDSIPDRTQLKIEITKKSNEEIECEIEKDLVSKFTFMDIIEAMLTSKKPIAVHNGFIDILHFYEKFIGSLPETHGEFKGKFMKEVASLFDTKFMLNNSNTLHNHSNPHTDLSTSYNLAFDKGSQKIEVSPDFPDYKLTGNTENNLAHEAGFDAFMTGVLFIKNLELTGTSLLNIGNLGYLKSDAKYKNDAIKFFKNKLPLGGVKASFNMESEEDPYSSKLVEVFHCYVISRGKNVVFRFSG